MSNVKWCGILAYAVACLLSTRTAFGMPTVTMTGPAGGQTLTKLEESPPAGGMLTLA